MSTKKVFAILAIGVVVVLGAVVLWLSPEREPSPESLVKSALTARDSSERVHATLALSQRRADGDGAMAAYASSFGRTSSPDSGLVPGFVIAMRKIADESKDPEVIAIAIQTLDNVSDLEGLPRYFAALENESPKVRELGWLAIKGHFPYLAGGLVFSPNAPLESRTAVVGELKKRLEVLNTQPSTKSATPFP